MPSCSIPGCRSSSKSNNKNSEKPKLTFHQFPSEKRFRDEWVDALNIPGFVPSRMATVCSLHFNPNWLIPKNQRTYLEPGAIPNAFARPASFIKGFAYASISDHTYQLPPTEIIKVKLDYAYTKIDSLIKKLKLAQSSVSYYSAKCEKLERVLKAEKYRARGKSVNPDSVFEVTESPSSDPSAQMFRKVTAKNKNNQSKKTFSIALRFSSLKSYKFVRDTFDFNLPNAKKIKSWFEANKYNGEKDRTFIGPPSKKLKKTKVTETIKKSSENRTYLQKSENRTLSLQESQNYISPRQPSASTYKDQSVSLRNNTTVSDSDSPKHASQVDTASGDANVTEQLVEDIPQSVSVKRKLSLSLVPSSSKTVKMEVANSGLESSGNAISFDDVVDIGELDEAIKTILGINRNEEVNIQIEEASLSS